MIQYTITDHFYSFALSNLTGMHSIQQIHKAFRNSILVLARNVYAQQGTICKVQNNLEYK